MPVSVLAIDSGFRRRITLYTVYKNIQYIGCGMWWETTEYYLLALQFPSAVWSSFELPVVGYRLCSVSSPSSNSFPATASSCFLEKKKPLYTTWSAPSGRGNIEWKQRHMLQTKAVGHFPQELVETKTELNVERMWDLVGDNNRHVVLHRQEFVLVNLKDIHQCCVFSLFFWSQVGGKKEKKEIQIHLWMVICINKSPLG